MLRASARTQEARIYAAAASGEGQKVEFKPFVDPNEKMKNGVGEKSKLHEVIVTAVAFANAEGGCIYLGVDDDCQIVGIESSLCKWAKGSISDSVIEHYLGALKSCIKSNVTGELIVETSHASIGNALIAVIQVQTAKGEPIGVQQDNYLYARTGASNRKVPPNQCKQVLDQLGRRDSPFHVDS